MKAFLDTYTLVALIDIRDQGHRKVKEYWDSMDRQMVIAEYILIELADSLPEPEFRKQVIEMIQRIKSNLLFEYIPGTPELFDLGLQLYSNRPDKAWSLTDCISFVVMTERNIIEALTADHHYRQAGFNPLFENRSP